MPTTKKRKPISNRELNGLMHDAMLHQLLDQLGAPKEQSGGVLSPFGRLRRIAPALLADKARMDWLCKFTEFRFRVYDSKERKFLTENLAQGVVIRPVVDAAMAKYPNP
jgi:hypothetical protein